MEPEVERKRRGTGAAVKTFLSGAALGAAGALLLSPESGKENRRKLGNWLKVKRDQGKRLVGSKEVAVAGYKDAIKKMTGMDV